MDDQTEITYERTKNIAGEILAPNAVAYATLHLTRECASFAQSAILIYKNESRRDYVLIN